MSKKGIRIFSYLPNPRIYKATIAGRLCNVEVTLRGSSPSELSDWLWDFDAFPLNEESKAANAKFKRKARTGFGGDLYKTDRFLSAHPYGTVPAAFDPTGQTGVFESNSIMRAVARQSSSGNTVYGRDAFSTSRIDSFLDVSLVFARDSQIYALALMKKDITKDVHQKTEECLHHWLTGIETALSDTKSYIADNELTLADICFACEYALLCNEKIMSEGLAQLGLEPILGENVRSKFPRAVKLFDDLVNHPAFVQDLKPYLEKIDKRAAQATS
tara:strand:- start:720 stop:1538 length:819 start_codon:yes stop_codon:yes gene_type:complete